MTTTPRLGSSYGTGCSRCKMKGVHQRISLQIQCQVWAAWQGLGLGLGLGLEMRAKTQVARHSDTHGWGHLRGIPSPHKMAMSWYEMDQGFDSIRSALLEVAQSILETPAGRGRAGNRYLGIREGL